MKSCKPWQLFVFLFFLTKILSAQNFEWDVTMLGFADNREYKHEVQTPQTFFGYLFIPELGLQFDTIHRIRAGVNILYEFGSQKFVDAVYPILYYHYSGQKFTFRFGSFSRLEIFPNAPGVLYYDSINYFRPYINGLIWTYTTPLFSQSVYLDWTSRQTETDRETFIMGSNGKFQRENLFVCNHIYMFHYAKSAKPQPNEYIRDNGVAYLLLGYNARFIPALDSMSFSIGGIQSYERSRNDMVWHTPKGVFIEVLAQYKGFGIRNVFYNGDGHNLDWGDPFYRLKRYNRLDIYFTPLRLQRVKGRFAVSLHFAEGSVSHQQQFYLIVNINSSSKNILY